MHRIKKMSPIRVPAVAGRYVVVNARQVCIQRNKQEGGQETGRHSAAEVHSAS